jgi:hypothetical protein
MTASTVVDFTTGAPVRGDLDVRWIHGSRGRKGRKGGSDPAFQVHAYDPHTYVLRQSKAISAEAPFIYLLFGNDRALLLDTGDGKQPSRSPLRETIDGIIAAWLAQHPRASYELVVAHTHGHGDHVAGDAQFADRPQTTVVGRELDAVREFFGLTAWPDQTVQFSTSAAGCWRSPAALVTTAPRSPCTTRGAGSCSPGTPCCAAGSMHSISLSSSRAWTGWWSSPAAARSRT